MIALLQRVTSAAVDVEGVRIGEINAGLLVLLGVEPDDNESVAERLLERVLNYRVFSDAEDKMNLSLRDVQGGLLLVPQFTLAANTTKGNRPSFGSAASPVLGEALFDWSRERLLSIYPTSAFGQFGANMQVSLVNDGPVTFWLQVRA